MMTVIGVELSNALFEKYLEKLIGRFYKILPLRESGETTLKQYILSLQREMVGCRGFIDALKNDDRYLSLLSMLQYMIDNDIDVKTTKSDVFRAISILKQLQQKYAQG